jgi:glucokinase
MLNYFLSGDIGGTKTLLQLSLSDNLTEPVLQKSYASAAYAGLQEIVDEFLSEAGIRNIASACFALAGPVNEKRIVKLTNLPWQVDADALAQRFSIKSVELINDFEAVAYGIAALPESDYLTVQTGNKQPQGTRLVVGAGTGLGVAWLTSDGGLNRVHASEAGHMDFAPQDEMQYALLRYMIDRYDHVSYERIVSGPGLVSIYEFIHDSGIAKPSADLVAAFKNHDASAVIAQYARHEDEKIARMAWGMFLSVYGAFVGNLALAVLPLGGIFVAGGVAGKNASQFQSGEFIRAFLSKGRYADMLSGLPVHIVLNARVGLLGASQYASRNFLIDSGERKSCLTN